MIMVRKYCSRINQSMVPSSFVDACNEVINLVLYVSHASSINCDRCMIDGVDDGDGDAIDINDWSNM